MANLTLEQAIAKANNLARLMAASPDVGSFRTQLTDVYTSDRWRSARYRAGEHLKFADTILKSDLDRWIDELEANLGAMRTNSLSYIETRTEKGADGNEKTQRAKKTHNFEVPDTDARLAAIKDLGWIYQKTWHHKSRSLLERVYHDPAPNASADPMEAQVKSITLAYQRSQQQNPRCLASASDFAPVNPSQRYLPGHFQDLRREAGEMLGRPPMKTFLQEMGDSFVQASPWLFILGTMATIIGYHIAEHSGYLR